MLRSIAMAALFDALFGKSVSSSSSEEEDDPSVSCGGGGLKARGGEVEAGPCRDGAAEEDIRAVGSEGAAASGSPKKKKSGKKKKAKSKKKDGVAVVPQVAPQKPPLTIILGNAQDGVRTITINRDISRNVARAAGVDWGSDEPTPRMVELQRRHDSMVDVAEAGRLTLHEIKDHNEFLAQLTRQIHDG